jgi:hypothetical protein
MKKNIWRLTQIIWLALAMLTVFNSIRALGSDANYCSGMSCIIDSDCGSACICNALDNLCYEVTRPTI